MTLAVFDLTPYTQFSVRMNTGLHPGGLSLGVHIGSEEIHLDEVKGYQKEGKDVPPEFSVYDAVDWERAVRFAKWILECDERFREA